MRVALCTDAELGLRAAASGAPVVAVGLDGGALGALAARARTAGCAGRVAVLVGDPDDPRTWDAAVALAAEVFRLPAVRVASAADLEGCVAPDATAGPPGPQVR